MKVFNKWHKPDLGLLLIRVALGIIFIAHGWAKLADLSATVAFFGGLGFAPILAYLVTAVEFLGGIALVLGVWTDLAGFLIAIVMLVALLFIKIGKMKLGLMGGYELDLILFASALGIMMIGPGKHVIKKKN